MLPRMASPALVLRGAASEMLERDQGEEMARGVQNGRLVDIPNAGHWTPLDNPTGVRSTLREFVVAT